MINLSIPYRSILILITALLSFALCGQNRSGQPKYKVEVLAPFEVEAESDTEAEFIITKGAYTGPMLLKQRLPAGFSLADPQPENATLDISGREFILAWENLPADDLFRFRLKFKVSTQNYAVYPFAGRILIDGEWIGYSMPVTANPRLVVENKEVKAEDATLRLFFEYPDVVRADESFTFVTTFVKDQNYTPSGELLQVWPDGFVPVPAGMANAEFEIRGRLVMLSWKQMANEPEFSMAYMVKVETDIAGAYPVISEYNDSEGLHLHENSGVFLASDKKDTFKIRAAHQQPVNIQLDFPPEVYKNDLLEFTCSISHAGLEGPIELHLKLPPEAELLSGSVKDFDFNRESATAIFHLNEMKENAVINISGRVDVSEVNPAVYPVLATLFHQQILEARKVGQLMVTKEPPKEKKPEKDLKPPEKTVDTTAMFSRLDALLDQWKKSTAADTQRSPDQTKVQKKPEPLSREESVTQQETQPPVTSMSEINTIKTCYCIQIAASKSALPDLRERIDELGIDLPLHEDFDGEWYRYMLGQFKMLREAIDHLEIVRNKGFPDAFIVNYLDGVRSKRIY